MTADIVYEHYIQNKVKIYDHFLGFIKGENDLKFDQNILKNRYEIKETIYMIAKIAQNHHRGPDFYTKIKLILDNFLDQIKQIYSIQEIYDLFRYNRIILVYLFEKGVLTPDQSLLDFLQLHDAKSIEFNSYYFYPEVKSYDPKIGEQMEKQLFTENPELLTDFNEKRLKGENDSYICTLIREDSIVDFIKYTTQNNYSLSSTISPSIFETNSYLISKKQTSLIEYAAFYGSIQIFQYLKQNNVYFDYNIWLYAIHGNNPIMIHQIESFDLVEIRYDYESILKEAIKCHHNDLAIYIKDNLCLELDYDIKRFYECVPSIIFGYFNFKLFPQKIDDNLSCLYYGCYYNYLSLIELLSNAENVDINKSIIIYDNIFKIF